MITDNQARVLINNGWGLDYDGIYSLTKEEASSIISDMIAGGFGHNSNNVGSGEFWSKVKKFIDRKL